MILCADVLYDEKNDSANIGVILIKDFADEFPHKTYELKRNGIEPYIPGQFYKRELPCLMDAYNHALNDNEQIDVIIIDGYCNLEPGHIGLGEHLFQELNESIPVIGVAKTEYKDAESIKVRGGLFVTASGIDAVSAAKYIETMHGKFKNPTILKNVDHLSRGIYKENKRPSKS